MINDCNAGDCYQSTSQSKCKAKEKRGRISSTCMFLFLFSYLPFSPPLSALFIVLILSLRLSSHILTSYPHLFFFFSSLQKKVERPKYENAIQYITNVKGNFIIFPDNHPIPPDLMQKVLLTPLCLSSLPPSLYYLLPLYLLIYLLLLNQSKKYPPPSVKCVNCGKPKTYTCSRSLLPLCSFECYKVINSVPPAPSPAPSPAPVPSPSPSPSAALSARRSSTTR